MALKDCVKISEELLSAHVKIILLEETVINAYRDIGDYIWEVADHVNAAAIMVQLIHHVIK